MRRSFIVAFIFVVIAGFSVSADSSAYTLFSGNNNCDQCHSGFDSYGADTHQSHISNFSCSSCHVSNGDNPLTSTCAECHDPTALWVFHIENAGPDQNGMTCASCHTVVPNENNSWDSIKSRYRDAVVSR